MLGAVEAIRRAWRGSWSKPRARKWCAFALAVAMVGGVGACADDESGPSVDDCSVFLLIGQAELREAGRIAESRLGDPTGEGRLSACHDTGDEVGYEFTSESPTVAVFRVGDAPPATVVAVRDAATTGEATLFVDPDLTASQREELLSSIGVDSASQGPAPSS